MTSSTFALQRALTTALETNTALRSRLGEDAVFDNLPRRAAFPYLTWGRVISSLLSAEVPTWEHRVELLAFAREGGRREVLELLEDARLVFSESALPDAEIEVVNRVFERTESQRSADGVTWRGALTFRFVTEANSL